MLRQPNHTIDETRNDQIARFYTRWFWWPRENHPNDKASGSIDLLLGHRSKGHGWGVVFGCNGSESDIGVNVYGGRLLSAWLRFRAPWTERFRRESSHTARHYGVRIRPHSGSWVRFEWGHDPMGGSEGAWSMNRYTLLGRVRSETETIDSGVCQIPMPEGVYPAEWEKTRNTSHHVGWLGVLRDRIFGPKMSTLFWVDVPGGIPVNGNGDNSWDCDIDGIFGTGGHTLHDAIGSAAAAALRDRDRNGGPHNLPHPMTVQQASGR